MIDSLCDRLRIANDHRDLAKLVARHHGVVHRVAEVRDTTLLDLLEHLDAFRRPERFRHFLLACEADMRGRTGFEDRPYPQGPELERARLAAAEVKLPPESLRGLDGPGIADRYRQARLAAIRAVRNDSQDR